MAEKARHCTAGLGARACLGHAETVLTVAHSATMGRLSKARDEGDSQTEHLLVDARDLISQAKLCTDLARAHLELAEEQG